MADKKKYYTALGLREGASQIEIKNAYKNLVSIYHPDVNKTSGAHKKMLEINEAYGELFNQILYNKEMNDLKKDPEAYHRARATYPIVFEDDEKGRNASKNTYTAKTHSSTAVKPYTKPKKPVNSTKSTSSVKKKDDSSSGLAPFCLGGAVVALIFALLSFPPLLFIGLIAIGAYFLLK